MLGVLIGYALTFIRKILVALLSKPYSISKQEKLDENEQIPKRMAGDSTTDAPLPEGDVKKKKKRNGK